MYRKFTSDLTRHQVAETAFAEHVGQTRHLDCYSGRVNETPAELKFWDVQFIPLDQEDDRDGKSVFYEIKNDVRRKRRKNVAIEYEAFGMPSGLSITKATYWGHIYWDDETKDWAFIRVLVSRLRQECVSGRYKQVRAGDNQQARLWLIPKTEFAAWGDVFYRAKVNPVDAT